MAAEHHIPLGLRAAYLAMHRQTDACLTKHGATADQFVLLSLLARRDGVTQQELVRRASSDPNTVRAMLILLEKRGLVARDGHPTDRRARSVTLTRKGAQVLKRLMADTKPLRSRLVAAFRPDEAKTLVELLGRISEALARPAAGKSTRKKGLGRMNTRKAIIAATAVMMTSALASPLFAQTKTETPRSGAPQGPQVVSPAVTAERKITFRILAPKAEAVKLSGSDIPGNGQGTVMTKGAEGVWEVTMGPIEPGAYRYNFNVDGVSVIDPRTPKTSESNDNTWSLVYVPGASFMETREVPRGAVAAVTYRSSALGRFRRMHVYTPPGYEAGGGKYPVFYLLHGAGDSDDSWTSVGRAGFILDNLIADRKAKPMIVVMPAGHTTSGGFRPPTNNDDFARDFLEDVMPYVEKHYRVQRDRSQRAIAGLSMGGNQSLTIAVPHLDKFAYVGVYSSGLIGTFFSGRPGAPTPPPPPPGPSWEEQNKAALDNASLKKGLKLLWFATGKDDFLVETTKKSVELFKSHGFAPVYKESAGGHTWINWREYLNEFAPMLFQ
jgi:enterochelin esterase family protein